MSDTIYFIFVFIFITDFLYLAEIYIILRYLFSIIII